MKSAVVFPGQGSQRPGMALEFAERYAQSQQVFECAERTLPFDVADLIHNEEERLNLTEFTQPCILTAEIAMFEALKAHYGFDPAYFGGHSLGEYAALVAAGALSLEAALQLVHLRGQLMQAAVPAGRGAMAALIQEDLAVARLQALANAQGVDVANDNSPAQVVLSGKADDVNRVIEALQPEVENGLRVVPLTVSAPFHSRHMAPIEEGFCQVLNEHRNAFDAAKAKRVTSNYLARFYSGDLDELLDALTHQISGTVHWRDNMAALAGVADTIVEVGPNRPLRGFFKAMGAQIKAVIDVRSAAKAFGAPQEVA